MAEYSVIGKSVPRVDALEKVTGKAEYAGDFVIPGMLYGKIVRSPYPHAKIINIDTSKAKKFPGVRTVVTPNDVPPIITGMYLGDMYVLPVDNMVRYVGEPVALVAADSPDAAEEGVDLVEVEYEELPAVFDVEEAFKEDCPVVVHENLEKYKEIAGVAVRHLVPGRRNVTQHFKIRSGDVEKGFKVADFIIEGKYSTCPIVHAQPEPHQSISWVKGDGTLVVRTTTQGIHMIRGALIDVLQLTANKVEVYSPYTGCGFGGRTWFSSEPYSAILTLKSGGRPVKVAFTREEVMIAGGHRTPITTFIKDGVKKDGTIIAREITMLVEQGAYSNIGFMITKNGAFGSVGTYRIPNFKLDSYGVYTNNPVTSAFRGFGSAEVLWGVENQMDVIARKIGMDPVKFRLMNILKEGEKDVCGQVTHSIGAEECLQRVADTIEWGKKSKEDPGPWKLGKGVASGNKYTIAGSEAVCEVKVYADGIEIRHGTDEMGQGHNTAMAQIAAEEFGISVDLIKVVRGDSVACPYDWGSLSSRSLYHAGNAMIRACRDAKRQVLELAAPKLGYPAEQLETSGMKVRVKGIGGKEIPIRDLFRGWGKTYASLKGEILGIGTHHGPIILEDENGQSARMVTYYNQGAYGVEVAVNTETGQVKVIKTAGCFDCGQPINPKMCEQQIDGGTVMGIGASLTEEIVLDNGRVLNPNYADYKLLTAADVPDNKNFSSMVTDAYPHKEGPYGAKGLGEGVVNPYAPAVSSAVYDAVGIRITDLPMTREKVLMALKNKEKKP
jgi:CO/xanthine dehydrogenase Mo-binding subunit